MREDRWCEIDTQLVIKLEENRASKTAVTLLVSLRLLYGSSTYCMCMCVCALQNRKKNKKISGRLCAQGIFLFRIEFVDGSTALIFRRDVWMSVYFLDEN